MDSWVWGCIHLGLMSSFYGNPALPKDIGNMHVWVKDMISLRQKHHPCQVGGDNGRLNFTSGGHRNLWREPPLNAWPCAANSFGLSNSSQVQLQSDDSSVYQWIFFPKLNISIKHRQIDGQSLRFALHERFDITVGCLLLWRKIRWFQQSRGWLKGSGSSDVWQVSVGPTRAFRLDPSLDEIVGMLTLSCQHYWFHIQNASQYFSG